MRLGIDGKPVTEEPNQYKMHPVKTAKPTKEPRATEAQTVRANQLTREGLVVRRGQLGNTVFRWK